MNDRARVPFALLGILLVLSSTALSVTTQPGRPASEPAVDAAMERATAETTTALRTSARVASDAAAREPLLSPADTTAGGVVNESEPFRDGLRIRIYLQARDRLDDLSVGRDDVTVTASLPPTPTASALREAKRRVHVEPADEQGTAVRVQVENVTLVAERDGRTVGTKEWTPTFVVRTPVLSLHERVERFDRRLNNGLTGPGLGRRVTGYSYALTWARGYAQYGGVPVTNVLGNGHLTLVTNHALLREQQAVFGQRDTAGQRIHAVAATSKALSEVPMPQPNGPEVGPHLLEERPAVAGPGGRLPSLVEAPPTAADDEMTVRVDGTADRALASTVSEANLSAVLRAAYTAEARPTATIRSRDGTRPDRPSSPAGDGWSVEECRTTRSVVDTDDSARRPSVGASGDWHLFYATAVSVDERVTRHCRWADGNDTTTTANSATLTYEVDVGVLGRYTHTDVAPDLEFERVGQATRDGPYPGRDPNFAAVQQRARERLVDDAGGPGTLAARKVTGDLDTGIVHVEGDRPDELEQWVVADLVALRSAVRNVSTTVRRGRVGTFEADPADELATVLEHRRTPLVEPPEEYGSVAHRALVAARTAYLAETKARLEARSDAHRDRRDALDRALARVDGGSTELLERALGNRTRFDAKTATPTDGVTVTAVSGSPPYLLTDEIDGALVDSVPDDERLRPLAARNVNVFTSPHGDATGLLVDALDSGTKVSFRAGAQTLAAAQAAADLPDDNESRGTALTARQAQLRSDVEAGLDVAEANAVETLAAADVGDSPTEREKIVERGLSRWGTTGDRAVAVSNGSAAEAIAAAAAPENETRRGLLEAELRVAMADATADPAVAVSGAAARGVSNLVRARVEAAVERRAEDLLRRAANETADRIDDRLERSVNRVPAGLPILPTGTPWWTTTNVWHVEVRGGYDRFAVSAERGSPDRPGASLTYVRDGDPVRIDYDADGTAERFGTADRVTFGVETAVGIAVPPGPQGVGDKDGQMVEESAGWDDWQAVRSADRAVPWAGPE